MVLPTHQSIFIHIPRCGGTSVENALIDDRCFFTKDAMPNILNLNYPLNHCTLEDIKKSRVLHPNFKKFYSFTFVRNPFDRLVSEFFYLKPKLKLSDDIKSGLIALSNYNNEGIYGNHCMSQHNFIKTNNPKISKYIGQGLINLLGDYNKNFSLDAEFIKPIDFVGRFENLQKDFNIICDKIGIPQQQLPHNNASNHKHYTEHYDEETREIVAEKYAKDIEYFGYKFGE